MLLYTAVEIGPRDAYALEEAAIDMLFAFCTTTVVVERIRVIPLHHLPLSQHLVDMYARVRTQIVPRSAIGDLLHGFHWKDGWLVDEPGLLLRLVLPEHIIVNRPVLLARCRHVPLLLLRLANG